jgi:hypothetical protein
MFKTGCVHLMMDGMRRARCRDVHAAGTTGIPGSTTRPAQRRAPPQNHRIFKIRYLINHGSFRGRACFLELLDSVNYAQTAREYGVDPITLRRRYKGK